MAVTVRKIEDDAGAGVEDPRDAQMRQMAAQIEGLTLLVKSALTSTADARKELEAKAPPLEPIESERERIIAAWAEERASGRVEAIFIAPDENDQKAAQALAARGLEPVFPPMLFQINGVQLAIPKGESYVVPASIAAMYRYMTNPWRARGVHAPITFEQAEARLGLAS